MKQNATDPHRASPVKGCQSPHSECGFSGIRAWLGGCPANSADYREWGQRWLKLCLAVLLQVCLLWIPLYSSKLMLKGAERLALSHPGHVLLAHILHSGPALWAVSWQSPPSRWPMQGIWGPWQTLGRQAIFLCLCNCWEGSQGRCSN